MNAAKNLRFNSLESFCWGLLVVFKEGPFDHQRVQLNLNFPTGVLVGFQSLGFIILVNSEGVSGKIPMSGRENPNEVIGSSSHFCA